MPVTAITQQRARGVAQLKNLYHGPASWTPASRPNVSTSSKLNASAVISETVTLFVLEKKPLDVIRNVTINRYPFENKRHESAGNVCWPSSLNKQ